MPSLENALHGLVIALKEGTYDIPQSARDRYLRILRGGAAKTGIGTSEACLDPGQSLLCASAKDGCTDILHFLLAAGVDFEKRDQIGATPIFYASEHGQTETARVLIEAGVDVNRQAIDGWTPLEVAVACGHLDTARVLEAAGAKLERELGCSASGEPFRPAFIAAASSGHEEWVRNFMRWGVDMEQPDPKSGGTPLIVAATYGHLGVVRLLVEAGADLEAYDYEGFTALVNATTAAQPHVVQYLIEKGVAVDQTTDLMSGTPLMVACLHGSLGIVQCLVDAGADVSYTCGTGKTPLAAAASSGFVDVVEYLLQKGARDRKLSVSLRPILL